MRDVSRRAADDEEGLAQRGTNPHVAHQRRNRAVHIQGESLAGAALQLEAAGLVSDDRQFRVLARIFGGDKPVKAGVYRFAFAAWRFNDPRCLSSS